MKKTAIAMATALVLPLALVAPQDARAYDPCQRALEQREVHRDAMNRYINNQCPRNARHIPSDCNNPGRGWELLETLQIWSARVQQECN